MDQLTKEEFEGWLAHPATKALRARLSAERETRRQQWEGGAFTHYEGDITATVLRNVHETGYCKGLAFVETVELDDLQGESRDGS